MSDLWWWSDRSPWTGFLTHYISTLVSDSVFKWSAYMVSFFFAFSFVFFPLKLYSVGPFTLFTSDCRVISILVSGRIIKGKFQFFLVLSCFTCCAVLICFVLCFSLLGFSKVIFFFTLYYNL